MSAGIAIDSFFIETIIRILPLEVLKRRVRMCWGGISLQQICSWATLCLVLVSAWETQQGRTEADSEILHVTSTFSKFIQQLVSMLPQSLGAFPCAQGGSVTLEDLQAHQHFKRNSSIRKALEICMNIYGNTLTKMFRRACGPQVGSALWVHYNYFFSVQRFKHILLSVL